MERKILTFFNQLLIDLYDHVLDILWQHIFWYDQYSNYMISRVHNRTFDYI